MKHDMEKIRAALEMLNPTFRFAGVLSDAINELAELRARTDSWVVQQYEKQRDAAKAELDAATSPVPGLAESGPYTLADVEAIEKHRGKPYLRLRQTVHELNFAREQFEQAAKLRDIEIKKSDALIDAIDFARADAARLRGELSRIDTISMSSFEGSSMLQSMLTEAGNVARAAIAATDSAEWLAKHDAEVRENDAATIRELRQKLAEAGVEGSPPAGETTIGALIRRCRDAEAKLAAAVNDAARAELRIKDLVASCKGLVRERVEAALAAAPDSDARLREVLAEAADAGWEAHGLGLPKETSTKNIIDEVLGVKS